MRAMVYRLPSACLLLCRRRRIDLGDPAQAIGFGIMRARNEGAADLGRIPAGDDTEAERFFCLDVTGREILHQVLSSWPFDLASNARDEVFKLSKPKFGQVSSPASR